MKLQSPLTLPNGSILANRLAKAAMEENMAAPDHEAFSAALRAEEAATPT